MKMLLNAPMLRRSSFGVLMVVVTLGTGCKHNSMDDAVSDSNLQEDPLLNDDCYAPSHSPTTADKDQWVRSLVESAKDAERIHGVPAAAMIAIASRESGYGLTKLYKGAKNPFGYKWTSTGSEGRPSWTLTCQPKEDDNNQYIAFKSSWDAMLFVAKKLATGSRYKATTDAYVKARKAGGDVKAAVDAWIVGIADAGYNYDPATYKGSITKMTNNYQSPSWTKSSSYNLYWVSSSVSPRSK